MTQKQFYMEIINHILSQKICTKEELHRAKIRLCRKHKINTIPPDSKILAHLPHDIPEWKKETAYSILRKKPMRTISGVAIVAVMTSPENVHMDNAFHAQEDQNTIHLRAIQDMNQLQ